MTPEEALVLNKWGKEALDSRRRCQEDIFFLGETIFGLNWENPADFHVETAKLIYDKEEFLLLAPRGHAKTTLNDVMGSVFDILREPDIRILINHQKLEVAKKIMSQATAPFGDKKSLLRRWFPEHCSTRAKDDPGQMSWTTPARKRARMEPTLMCTGIGGKLTALHFDVIKCTDLVSDANVPPWSSPEEMQKVVEHFATLIPLLDHTNPEARRQCDGTRWHDGDLYGEIIRAAEAA